MAAGYNYMSRGDLTDDDRNTSSYGENVYCSDHVCRPVMVDAEGRKRPIISYASPNANSETYVTKTTERIVEHVLSPAVLTDYNKYNSRPKVEPLIKDYGVSDDKWTNPSSPVYDRPEYYYNSQPKLEPMRRYGVTGDNSPAKVEPFVKDNGVSNYKGNNPSNPVYDRPEYSYNPQQKLEPMRKYGVTNDNWRISPLIESQEYRPPKVVDFITKVQTEVSQPTRPGLLSATHWRNTPNSTGQGYGGINSYGGDQYANNNKNNNSSLSGTISEIGKAVEIMKEAVNPSSITAATPHSRSARTIDSREAAKRYGNLNLSSRPLQTGESYMGTIDSREAARKYGGATV